MTKEQLLEQFLSLRKIDNHETALKKAETADKIYHYLNIFKNIELSSEFEKYIQIYIGYLTILIENYNKYQISNFDGRDYYGEKINVYDILHEMLDKIENSINMRSKILGKTYNYLTNSIELELENGDFIKLNSDNTLVMPIVNLNLDVFPIQFLHFMEEKAYLRDKKINSLLNE